jgi:acyl-coenzyme A thioesterase PaaI-like protein
MTAETPPDARRLSAFELGRLLGEALPTADSVGYGELALAEAARSLLEAVVVTDVDDLTRARLARTIAKVTEELRANDRPDPIRLVRHPDGRIENLLQAAAGRCNPRSLRLTFEPPEADAEPEVGVEVRGHVVLDASASGPPTRAHGGIAATILDEAIGVALMRSGRTGLTVRLEIDFRAGLLIGVPVDVRARTTTVEGRKTFATGELLVDGEVTCRAAGLFVAARGAG